MDLYVCENSDHECITERFLLYSPCLCWFMLNVYNFCSYFNTNSTSIRLPLFPLSTDTIEFVQQCSTFHKAGHAISNHTEDLCALTGYYRSSFKFWQHHFHVSELTKTDLCLSLDFLPIEGIG